MIRINLLTPERTKKAAAPAASTGTLQLVLLLALFGGGAALVCAGGWWFQKAKLEELDRQIAADERKQRELQVVQQQVDEFQKKKAMLENKVLVIERLRLSQKSPVHMLDEISKSLPDYVWLVTYDESRGAISLKGQSNSLAAVADFMNGLQRSGWFPTIELASAQEQQNLVNFDLTGQFKDPEVAAKEAALAPKDGAKGARPGAGR
jgi:type IV pilus assembly protein PilN